MLRNVDIDNDSFKHIEAIIQSMTVEERSRPSLINGSRRKRIARGSGTEVKDVNNLLSQFMQMKKAMKKMNTMSQGGGKMNRAMKNMSMFNRRRR